tara:strand:- start:2001 stop:3254 length:1254 start_codon:yes stop_codon:yes gene_type:complete
MLTIEELTTLYTEFKYSEVIRKGTEFVAEKPDETTVWNLIALSNKNLGQVEEAKLIYEKLLKNAPNDALLLYNLGNLHSSLGNFEKAISAFQHVLKLRPKLPQAIEALGINYSRTGALERARSCFEENIELNPHHSSARFYLADTFRKLKKYEDAIFHFELTDYSHSKIFQLECIYYLNDRTLFDKKYMELSSKSAANPLLGCITTHASRRFKMEYKNGFCSNPLHCILHKTSFLDKRKDKNFISSLVKFADTQLLKEKNQDLLQNGVQSAGNLFLLNNKLVSKLHSLIQAEIENYREWFNHTNEPFLQRWPKRTKLYGWFVQMQSGGKLEAHIHKEGWLSGSIYLSVPELEAEHGGDIVFTLHGANYPTGEASFPECQISVEKGDICLFPSSLFHYTTPFSSTKHRISLAFDVIPY